jgi:DNA-binding Xre family transcriptional regulator
MASDCGNSATNVPYPQVELARLAGVSPYTVSKLERQRATSCRTRTLARLAAALGEEPSAIVPNVGQRSD